MTCAKASQYDALESLCGGAVGSALHDIDGRVQGRLWRLRLLSSDIDCREDGVGLGDSGAFTRKPSLLLVVAHDCREFLVDEELM